MASLGNTIINGILRVNGKINVGDSISAPSFIGELEGNAATATTAEAADKLTTARTVSLTGDATASGSFDGTANLSLSTTVSKIKAVNDRDIKPSVTTKGKFAVYFTTKAGLTGKENSDYQDLLVMNGWVDAAGGNVNALSFDKSTKAIYHYQAAQTATTWGTPSQIAYITSNVASATKLQTARTINGVSFDGTKNITITDNTKLPLAGGTMTGTIQSSVATNTFINGNNGEAIINSTGTGGNYVTFLRKKSSNGVFTLNGYQNKFILGYTSDETISSGANHLDNALYYSEGGYLYPSVNGAQDLGIATNHWRTVYSKSFIGDLTGTAKTADKLTTARTVSLTGDATASGSFDGTANLSLSTVVKQMDMIEDRDIKPSATPKGKFSTYFTSKAGLTGKEDSNYQDLLVMNSWYNTSGGNVNALVFDKSSKLILHYQAAQTATTWGTPSIIAYTSSNVASATKLQTARTIGVSGVTGTAQSFDGSKNIVIPITAVPASLITGTVASATKAKQLTTARTINGVSFNGTANISINKLVPINVDNKTINWNTYNYGNGYTEGIWQSTYDGGSTGFTNLAVNGKASRIELKLTRANTQTDYIQVQEQLVGNGVLYRRYCNSGNWSSWTVVLNSGNCDDYTTVVHSGTRTPSSSLGKNGDLYVLI